jgi:hypothetical protein
MRARIAIQLFLPALISLSLPGCLPPHADYEVGFGTTEIIGTVRVGETDPVESDAIIVILKNHYKFIPLSQTDDFFVRGPPETIRSITHPTAHIQRVDPSGRFLIHMPADVISVDIMFIAADHLTDTFHFARSLGLGRITYVATLRAMHDWRSHFYTYLEPQLQHLIVEQRYRMADKEQKALGDWLHDQKRRIEAGRSTEGDPARRSPSAGPQ